MTVPGSTNPLLMRSAAAAYTVQRSLRFNSADTAYLSRTPASVGNRKTWTWSGWVKRAKLGSYESLFSGQNGQNYCLLWFYPDNTLVLENYNNGTAVTTAKFTDTGAWCHIVCTVNTTNATAADRIILYVNGVRQTVTGTDPTLNSDLNLNQAVEHRISSWLYGGADLYALNSYMAEVHFIDGQAKTPSDFAETNVTTGQWVPKLYSGTYGTNGFKLTFSDNSNTTAATLGADTSGNGNNWTPNNFSVTAGAGNDSLRDTPTSGGTDTGVGGEVRGNYCTWNALTPIGPYPLTLANGNLEAKNACGTFSLTSGKWYWEIATQAPVGGAYPVHGLYATSVPIAYPANSPGIGIGADGTTIYIFGSTGVTLNVASSFTSTAWAANDIIMFAFDADSKKIWMGRNGTWYNSGAPASGTGHVATMMTSAFYSPGTSNENYTGSCTANFGQRAWAYTAPSGFKALCDTNLTAPTIAKPNTVMDTVLYTGNGSARSITGLNFNPDLVWIKNRSGTADHDLYDVVRGAQKRLESNNTDAEVTSDNGVTAFNSNGFSLGTLAQVNTNSNAYAGWTWDAGSSNATNTSGTISSTVRANTTAGFSIVTYTGNSTAGATIGHGLGAAPELLIIKCASAAGDWIVYSKALGNNKSLFLDLTLGSTTTTNFNNTTPSSTVFTVGSSSDTNAVSTTYVAYCWTPVTGHSAFGSYTGNGSTDGPHINVGFRPAVVVVKRSSSTGDWTILDDKREGYNVDNDPLYPNLPDGEGITDLIDITSNGFKIRTTDATFNFNTGTYVYAAWASAPFPYARAR